MKSHNTPFALYSPGSVRFRFAPSHCPCCCTIKKSHKHPLMTPINPLYFARLSSFPLRFISLSGCRQICPNKKRHSEASFYPALTRRALSSIPLRFISLSVLSHNKRSVPNTLESKLSPCLFHSFCSARS